MKAEEEENYLRTVVANGIERDDLRDEIYVMCRDIKVFQLFHLQHINNFVLLRYAAIH